MHKKIAQCYSAIIVFGGLMHFTYANSLPVTVAKMDYVSEHWFPKAGRVIASGALVNIGVFGGDGMLPLFGNLDHFVFGNVLGGYGTNDTALASPGLGYRTVMNDIIAGGYLFGDYDHTNWGADFGVLSPGLEIIGLQWDAHLNGYFPTKKTQRIGATNPASYYGLGQGITFKAGTHNQYAQLINQYAVVGNGLDGEVGYSFTLKENLRSRVYLGGYYYQPPNNYQVDTLRGVTAGFSQSLNKIINVAIFNSYDQVNHYNIGCSINFVFGGEVNTFSKNIHDRLLDPVQRHVGIIATGAGAYAQRSFKSAGYSLIYNNIFFFAPNGLAPSNGGNGTYGNPLSLSQASLDYVDSQSPSSARLYLQGGEGTTYKLMGGASFTALQPYSGQDFYGRSGDYTAAAIGNQRPIIYLASPDPNNEIFHLTGSNTKNLFTDLQFTSDYTAGGGLSNHAFEGDSTILDLTFNNVNITNFDNAVLYIHNSLTTNLQVLNSTFTNNLQVLNAQLSNGTINFVDSLISTTSAFPGPSDMPAGISLENAGSNTVNFIANNLSMAFDENIATGSGMQFINNVNGDLNAFITGSTITSNTVSADIIQIQNYGSGNVNASINQSVINSTSGSGLGGSSGNIEIDSYGSGTTTLNFISSRSTNGSVFGLGAFNELGGSGIINLNIQNSVLAGSGADFGLPFVYGNLSALSFGDGIINLSAINSTLNNSPTYGLTVINNYSSLASVINVNDLSGTSFTNNSLGGITAYTVAGNSTTINYTNALFVNSNPTISYYAGSQAINWIPSPP